MREPEPTPQEKTERRIVLLVAIAGLFVAALVEVRCNDVPHAEVAR